MEAQSVSVDRKVKALVNAGYYSSELEVIKDAMRSLFRENAELKVNAAIELYKEEEVSLSKAAEMAGVTTIEFKDILGKRGIIREIEARQAVEMDRKLKKYLKT
jgi:predicted HTH domain antitoxin